jgi:uncharacterized protein
MITYPLYALRAVALCVQRLNRDISTQPVRDTIYDTVNQIGCVQIDTLHMVRRSHYLVLWSRIGNYEPNDLDALSSRGNRRLFEGWQHAASIIPLSEYCYQLPRQREMREHPGDWYNRWLNDSVQSEFIPQVLERIRTNGPLRVSDFESDGHQGGTWWNWRPAKVALEFLFANGELMVTDRAKFQRVYDLTERVLPSWVNRNEPTIEERDRFWIERGAKALGVFLPRHAGDYTWMKVGRSKSIVESLVKEGLLISISGRVAKGETCDLLIHRDNWSLLEQAMDGSLRAERTTFLSPFDNLWWAHRRDELFWGFHQSLEAYLPASKRHYGYFCMPILHKDRFVGRFDPKLERRNGILRLKSFFLEPGVAPDEELIQDIAIALHDFMAFHGALDLIIDHCQPADFSKKIMKKL